MRDISDIRHIFKSKWNHKLVPEAVFSTNLFLVWTHAVTATLFRVHQQPTVVGPAIFTNPCEGHVPRLLLEHADSLLANCKPGILDLFVEKRFIVLSILFFLTWLKQVVWIPLIFLDKGCKNKMLGIWWKTSYSHFETGSLPCLWMLAHALFPSPLQFDKAPWGQVGHLQLLYSMVHNNSNSFSWP